MEKIETKVTNVWNKDDVKSSEEAPCLNGEISKSHNNVSPMKKITNVEILCRTGLPSMIKKNVRLLVHVRRMDNNRLPKQLSILFGNA